MHNEYIEEFGGTVDKLRFLRHTPSIDICEEFELPNVSIVQCHIRVIDCPQESVKISNSFRSVLALAKRQG